MVKEVNIFRLQSSYKHLQDISPQRAFQNHYKGFAVRTPSKQTGPVYLGLGVLLITLSFLFTGILFPFVGSRERTVFSFFLVIFTKNEVTSPLLTSICVKDKTQHFVTVFF